MDDQPNATDKATSEHLLAPNLDRFVPPAPAQRPHPKHWTGMGKLCTGIAIAGAKFAGGIAFAVGAGPLAAGITVGGVLASCASGIGAISEGVGALRGE